MPGPFPGMDPYLEAPALWRGVHHQLISYTAEALNLDMPEGFVADIDERLYVVEPGRSIYPDVLVSSPLPERPGQFQQAVGKRGGTAVMEQEDTPDVLTVYPETITEAFIEIRAVTPPKRVVTIIEVLSPANKARGSVGRQEYLTKQREVLHSAANLLEIDLLRRGAHTVAAPRDGLRRRGRWDYLICLHCSAKPYDYAYWMNSVRQRLPRVLVPLTEGVPDARLDLQAVFDRCYDSGRYPLKVDYSADPPTPLQGDDATWADALLREKGLRA